MKTINKYLCEFYPQHPQEVVVKNKYYPHGLTELDVYNYYLSIQDKLLKWIANRNVAFLMRITQKDTVIRRNNKGVPIKLNSRNYQDLITGRTNVIYVTHPSTTNYFVIDIDPGKNLDMRHSIATSKYLLKELGVNAEVITSSDKGIHYIGYVNKNQTIDKLREKINMMLEEHVNSLNLLSRGITYTINQKGRANNTINLDLSPMYKNSLHIARYSLTKEFLICDDIKYGLKRVKRKRTG